MNNVEIKYDTFLKGKIIDLVCVTEEIITKSNWHNWFNNEENIVNMQKHYYPNTVEEQLEYFRSEVFKNRSKLQLGIFHKRDQFLIGTISLSNIDHINNHCEIGGLIGEMKYQNIDCWLEANRLLIHHAVNTLNMHRIYAGSISKEVSIFYERLLGFKTEGVHEQEVFKNGKYHDVYYFAKVYEPKIS